MSKKTRQPTARLPVEGWIVYIVQCADGSFYTGITKDVVRRCQQHNAGTASRYTRSRGPVKLVYQEDHPDQSSALKREAAIKAMDRRGKLTMVKQSKPPAKAVRQIARLEDIPNVGPAVAGDLRQLGITSPGELPGRDPYALYDDLCRITGQRHDLCMLDTFIAAVRYMEGAPKRPWWKYTAERKQEMTARREARPGTMMPSLCEPARTSGRSASHGPGSCSVSCPPRTPLTRSTRPSRSFSATATVPGTMPKRASRVIGTKPVDGRDGPGKAVAEMLPLYHDPHFTFRFADDRIIPRFHLEGVEAGRRVAVYKIDPDSGERLGLLAMAGVGEGGWVDLPEPITVRAGDAFIAVPDSPS